jgi:hypothetical protein
MSASANVGKRCEISSAVAPAQNAVITLSNVTRVPRTRIAPSESVNRGTTTVEGKADIHQRLVGLDRKDKQRRLSFWVSPRAAYGAGPKVRRSRGPAEAALRAWRKLAASNLPWKPDSVSIVEDDQGQIARHRIHTIGLSDLLARVEARGGATTSMDLSDAASAPQ